jgi:hypothetical protein
MKEGCHSAALSTKSKIEGSLRADDFGVLRVLGMLGMLRMLGVLGDLLGCFGGGNGGIHRIGLLSGLEGADQALLFDGHGRWLLKIFCFLLQTWRYIAGDWPKSGGEGAGWLGEEKKEVSTEVLAEGTGGGVKNSMMG